jgi:hypothetical protein
MACKVEYTDLESVTKFLDNLPNLKTISKGNFIKIVIKAKDLSKMIKDKYTEIKPDYERKS